MAFNVTVDLGDAGDIGSVKLQSCTGNGSGCVDIAGSTSVAVPSGLPKTVSVPDGTTYIRAVALGACSSATPLSIQVTGIPAATPTPTPTPTLTPTPTAGPTTNTFNNTNGPAKLFPASSLGFGSWSLSINNSTGFSLEVDSSGMGGGYSVTASTVFTTPSPDYAKINLAGTSSATSIGFTIVGQNITNNNITGTSTLKITDGTNMYNGTGVALTGSDSNKFTVTFDIGPAKGRTLYWGTSSTNATKGELDIGAQ